MFMSASPESLLMRNGMHLQEINDIEKLRY